MTQIPGALITPARDPVSVMRRAGIRRFVRARFGPLGSLRLHRHALGLDLLRAPLNVALSPLYLLVRMIAGLLNLLRLRRAAAWLGARQIFLTSNIARQVESELNRFIADLDSKGAGVAAPPETVARAVADYAGTRNAVAEMTTSALVLLAGFSMFEVATPGVISLAGPVAEMRAQNQAIDNFALGRGLGRLWYGAFPVRQSWMQLLLTGTVLTLIASVVTTFAGLLADPLQVLTGTHRRRIDRLLARLDAADPQSGALPEREHLMARLGELSDAALVVWRNLRG